MPLIRCPSCSRTLSMSDRFAGRLVLCPACDAWFGAPARPDVLRPAATPPPAGPRPSARRRPAAPASQRRPPSAGGWRAVFLALVWVPAILWAVHQLSVLGEHAQRPGLTAAELSARAELAGVAILGGYVIARGLDALLRAARV